MEQEKNNSQFLSILLIFGLLIISLCGCSSGDSDTQKGGIVEAIAREASQGVGLVRKTYRGTKGTPILILEENHTNRAGQIQHAIALVRLHKQQKMRHIALEGYLKELPEITRDWFTNAAYGLDSMARARVAVRLLVEGEISCAEFMKLVYDDISLHPIETKTEYAVELRQNDYLAPLLYLFKIAEKSLRQEHMPRLNQLMEDFKRAENENNSELIEKKRKEIFNFILSADSWAQDKARVLQDIKAISSMSEEQQLALAEEIANRAEKLSIDLKPEEKKAMEQYLTFFRGRLKASRTMIVAAEEIADLPGIFVVAMVVGAAHTEGMCTFLRNADRPFAVIRSLSFLEIDLPWDMFERKYKRLSVYSEGFTETLLKAFPPPKHKKPEPVLSEPWFQGKAELYLFTERIASGRLGPPRLPSGGKPPYGFADDEFNGRWIYIDPKLIKIISDTDEGKGRAVLFSAILNPNNPERSRKIWVKAGLSVANVLGQERENIESMLMRALQEVQSEKEPSKKVEDNAGRVQITINTVAAYATTEQDAQKVILGSI